MEKLWTLADVSSFAFLQFKIILHEWIDGPIVPFVRRFRHVSLFIQLDVSFSSAANRFSRIMGSERRWEDLVKISIQSFIHHIS